MQISPEWEIYCFNKFAFFSLLILLKFQTTNDQSHIRFTYYTWPLGIHIKNPYIQETSLSPRNTYEYEQTWVIKREYNHEL